MDRIDPQNTTVAGLSPAARFQASHRKWTQSNHRLKPLNVTDRLTLVYLLYSTALILVCHRNIPRWQTLLPIHFGLIAMVIGLAYARAKNIKLLSHFSHWYPTLLFLFFFEEIGSIVHAIFPGWFDGYLIEADYAIFRAH